MAFIRIGDVQLNFDSDRTVAHLELAIGRALYAGRAFLLTMRNDSGDLVSTLVSTEIPLHISRGPVGDEDLDTAVVAALADSLDSTRGIMIAAIADPDTAGVAEVYQRLADDDPHRDEPGRPDPRAY